MDRFNKFCDDHPTLSGLLDPLLALGCIAVVSVLLGGTIGCVIWVLTR